MFKNKILFQNIPHFMFYFTSMIFIDLKPFIDNPFKPYFYYVFIFVLYCLYCLSLYMSVKNTEDKQFDKLDWTYIGIGIFYFIFALFAKIK